MHAFGHHIDAYQEYNWLVGEADGGSALPQKDYDELRRKAVRIHEEGTRLYVYWLNTSTGMECYCVGPDSKCFCGHSYKAHAWYEVETRKVWLVNVRQEPFLPSSTRGSGRFQVAAICS